jgi:hypothetical protein
MSITLNLPHELEQELSVEAEHMGLSLSDYVLRILSTTLAGADKPKTGKELVEYWRNEGLVGTRPDISDSQSHATEIRKKAENRSHARE